MRLQYVVIVLVEGNPLVRLRSSLNLAISLSTRRLRILSLRRNGLGSILLLSMLSRVPRAVVTVPCKSTPRSLKETTSQQARREPHCNGSNLLNDSAAFVVRRIETSHLHHISPSTDALGKHLFAALIAAFS
ncbi:unnamed protein product [Haemonchus placei]|uniref:Secreted protein n=1 Tax=Haemonchus placei TaxID=6290 RepID=A0A0N4WRC8_HAEPC|nr:unnamed protein product [Haemonchus placei]